MSVAVYRLIHDKVGGLKALHVKQVDVIGAYIGNWVVMFTKFCDEYSPIEYPADLVRLSALAAHPKQKIRKQALEELDSQGYLYAPREIYMDRDIQAKLKLAEWAKPLKYGRIIADFGTPASIRAGWLIEIMKGFMNDMANTPAMAASNGRCVFVKTGNLDSLTRVFQEALEENIFHFHSDDSRGTFMTAEGPLWIDFDISACDSSQGPHVFQTLAHLVPERYKDDILALLTQCQQIAAIGYGEGKYKIVPEWYFEFSGTLLTTFLNNIASLTVGMQLMSIPTGNRLETIERVRQVLLNCGWVLEMSVCEIFEDCQFLKCSPFYSDNGRYDVYMNLGVIMRAIGQKHGDLPGSKKVCIEDRAVEFNSQLISGFRHCGDTSLYRLLVAKFGVSLPVYTNANRLFLDSTVTGLAMDISICARYRIELGDYHELLSLIEFAGYGDIIDCKASQAILQKDYGL